MGQQLVPCELFDVVAHSTYRSLSAPHLTLRVPSVCVCGRACAGEVGKFPAGSREREAVLDTLVSTLALLDPVKEQSLYVVPTQGPCILMRVLALLFVSGGLDGGLGVGLFLRLMLALCRQRLVPGTGARCHVVLDALARGEGGSCVLKGWGWGLS